MATIKLNKTKDLKARKNKIDKTVTLLSKYFNFFPPAVLLIILTLGFFFLLIPKYRTINSEIKELAAAKNAEYDTYYGYFEKFNKLIRSYREVPPGDLERIDGLMADRPDPEELMPMFEAIVAKNGLLLDSLSFDWSGSAPAKGKAKNTGGLGEIKVSMSVSGADYESSKHFLGVLESNLRIINVEKVALGGGGLKLELICFYKK